MSERRRGSDTGYVEAVARFYDQLSPLYEVIYQDWERSVKRGAAQIDALIGTEWNQKVTTILDATCGIGTQALGLAALGYTVTASDISPVAVERTRTEAQRRDLRLQTATADLRELSRQHQPHDLVLAWDNALPHLLSEADIRLALSEMFRCTRPGGGCLLSVRDYDKEPRHSPHMLPYGVRRGALGRTAVFQVRDWDGDCYDVSFYFVEDIDGECTTTVVRGGRYYAISVDRLLVLMSDAGFVRVRRDDDRFFQPALVGHKLSDASTA